MRYKNESSKKENGIVYTPERMANYVAEEMVKYWKPIKNQKSISILDPAAGEGSLLEALINKVLGFGMDIQVSGYETDENVAKNTQKQLEKKYKNLNIKIQCADFLDEVSNDHVGKYDFVIANPPYIRTQILGSEKAQEISQSLGLTGRVDIYYAFLVYTKLVLKENGIAGYITSNKFMTIKAGLSVRNYMLENYCLYQITDLGDTKLFNAAVLPCIMIFSLGKTTNASSVNFTSVYEEHGENNAQQIGDIFDAIHSNGFFKITDGRIYKIQQGHLKSSNFNDLWTLSSSENKMWLSKVESNTWMTFSNLGKIRVGIKTTADNVFIGDDWTGEKANIELLRPLITHRNAGQIIGHKDPQWKVLYTHTMNGKKKVAYDINKFPVTKKYLLEHYDQLSERTYLQKANRNWYEIWVPQNPSAWEHRKIVFRDISEMPEFWLDESGAIVNGDCYWIDINANVPEDIVYLALAVANSEFIEKFYDIKFNTKLYSGKRRYQTQYVEQFPIPYYGTKLAEETISIVKKIVDGEITQSSTHMEKINELVNQMFIC